MTTVNVYRRDTGPTGVPDMTPPSEHRRPWRDLRQCAICGDPYLMVTGGVRDTCSQKCKSENIARIHRFLVPITCGVCARSFQPTSSQQQFCSAGCRQAALNSRPRKPVRTALCRICEKPFPCPEKYRRPNTDGRTRGLYCSRECMWTDDDYCKRRVARNPVTKLERWLFAVLDADGIRYEKFATAGRYVPDALLDEYRVIIEVDGVVWHRMRVARDQQRDRELAAAGYTVMHFTDLEMNTPNAARRLIKPALSDIRAGRAAYRAPLLWRPGTEP